MRRVGGGWGRRVQGSGFHGVGFRVSWRRVWVPAQVAEEEEAEPCAR